MQPRSSLSSMSRTVAAVLALVWIVVGVVSLVLSLVHERWLLALLAVVAILYGVAWIRVAAHGRLLRGRDLVTPWRPPRSGDDQREAG
jgi:membrane protease YdiL (CAAX protease family)